MYIPACHVYEISLGKWLHVIADNGGPIALHYCWYRKQYKQQTIDY